MFGLLRCFMDSTTHAGASSVPGARDAGFDRIPTALPELNKIRTLPHNKEDRKRLFVLLEFVVIG